MRGRWKLVTSASTARNRYGGRMYLRVHPDAGAIAPFAPSAMDSSARTLVVPTATIRPPAARAARIASAASSPTSYNFV